MVMDVASKRSFVYAAAIACSLLSFPLVAATDAACDPHDKDVLLQIKAHFKVWPFSNWDPKTNCCQWDSIVCGLSGRVTSLQVSNAQLNGSLEIPPVIGQLDKLEILGLDHMNLVGSIPESITKLPNLYQLFLGYTNLSGPLPDFSNMKTLFTLGLLNNSFSGPIPSNLHLLPNLYEINLANNMLNGSIPESFGLFKNEMSIWLEGNKELSGDIPKSLGQVNFSRLHLSDNHFTGDASFLLGKDKPISEMCLDNNEFEFDFSNVELPLRIRRFDIGHNKIYGSLNKQLGQLRNMIFFSVSNNQLCGKVPKGRRFKQLSPIAFEHNKCLCDALGLPPCNSY